MSALLEVHDLVAGYGDHEILRGLSLRVEPGEIVAVIGPNGAGKSTLLKAIVGLLPARRGGVRFRDRDLAGVGAAEIIAQGLCYVPRRRTSSPRSRCGRTSPSAPTSHRRRWPGERTPCSTSSRFSGSEDGPGRAPFREASGRCWPSPWP